MQKDALNEQLSALADDELRRDEALFLTRRLSQSPEAVEQLSRYFLISDALRKQLPETIDLGLAERVAAALEHEESFNVRPSLVRRVAKPVAGLGVAASVAVAAITLMSPDGPSSGTVEGAWVAAAATAPSAAAVAVTPVSVSDSQWERLDPEVQRRLNLYLVNHSEHSSAGQWGGVLNYVRITGHSDRD
jgi:Negative regulator of sigma E activity